MRDGLGDGPVPILGTFPPDPDPPSPFDFYYRSLDQFLKGWMNHCGDPNSLAWLIQKLAPASQAEWEAETSLCDADDEPIMFLHHIDEATGSLVSHQICVRLRNGPDATT